jgi:hypothetical protein
MLEAELVDDLARIILLRKRASCFEAAILDARGEELIVSARRARSDLLVDLSILRASREEEEEEQDEKTPEAEWRLQVGKLLLHDAANGDVLAKVDRHRATLINELTKVLKLLLLLQEKRTRDPDRTLMIEETSATSDRGDNCID